MDQADEVVQYLLIRADLKLAKGKAIAQAGHGVQLAIRAVERAGDEASTRHLEWEGGSYTKIALKVNDQADLDQIAGRLAQDGVIHAKAIDEGRTAVEPGTTTVLALQPLPKSIARKYVGAFLLY